MSKRRPLSSRSPLLISLPCWLQPAFCLQGMCFSLRFLTCVGTSESARCRRGVDDPVSALPVNLPSGDRVSHPFVRSGFLLQYAEWLQDFLGFLGAPTLRLLILSLKLAVQIDDLSRFDRRLG